jgi:hypothetical protein
MLMQAESAKDCDLSELAMVTPAGLGQTAARNETE